VLTDSRSVSTLTVNRIAKFKQLPQGRLFFYLKGRCP